MKVKIEQELHVETPDRIGVLAQVLEAVGKSGAGMQAMVAYAQSRKGHFMMLTSDNARAAKAIRRLGHQVEAEKVVVAEFDDKKGTGAGIAQKLARAGIYSDYAYSGSRGKKVLFVLSTSDNEEAVRVLEGKVGKAARKKK